MFSVAQQRVTNRGGSLPVDTADTTESIQIPQTKESLNELNNLMDLVREEDVENVSQNTNLKTGERFRPYEPDSDPLVIEDS